MQKSSNNSSKITEDSSNILISSRILKSRQLNINQRYLNSSIFESQNLPTESTEPNKSDIYLTEISDIRNIETQPNRSENIMRELFDFKPTESGRILPSIKRKPPTMIYCCDKKYEANNLSNLYDKFWVHPPQKKVILNFKRERTKVRDTSSEYIEKTKSIILARYNLKIKEESKKRIEDNIKKEIQSLDNTIKIMGKYKDDLEHNFIQKYNNALKKLNNQMKEEKIKNEELTSQLSSILKEVNNLKSQIKKVESNKILMEKWISFQIRLDKGIITNNLKETLKNEYNNQLIFQDLSDFEDWFERAKNKNLKLLDEYNKKEREKDLIKKKYYEEEKLTGFEITLENEIQEKEKLLNLLKLRNQNLENEKKNIIKSKSYSPGKKGKKQSYEKPKKLKDSLYIKSKTYYNHIIEELSGELTNINFNKEIDGCITKENKLSYMITAIEISFNYLNAKYEEYKKNPSNKEILKEIQEKIDLQHKISTANQRKLEEQNKIEELASNIKKRDKKFIYVPKRKVDIYPFALFQKEKINYVSHESIKKEPTLFDFLYDNELK